MKEKRSINPYLIRGDKEFYQAFGVKDPKKQAEMRGLGMPCYNDGKAFMYDPDEVKEWIKENYKIQRISI
jgi:hypothetical protein